MMRTLILKATRACNLRCAYCYYINEETDGYGKLFDDRLVRRLYETHARHADRPGERINLIWHGGEPLVLGKKRFRRFLAMQKDHYRHATIANRLQTNGCLIDEEWADIFAEEGVSVGISIDGPQDIHDRLRPTVNGDGSWHETQAGIAHLRRRKVPFGILTVADPMLAGTDLFDTLVSQDYHYFDLLLPITNNAIQEACPSARVDMERVGEVLVETFRAWVRRDDPSFHIRLFEALMVNAVGGGHNCSNAGLTREAFGAYAIVETDGAICLDAEFSEIDRNAVGREYHSGFNLFQPDFSFDDAFSAIATRMDAAAMDRIPADCHGCEVMAVCRGSHPGSRYGGDGTYFHRSAYCAAMKAIGLEIQAYLSEHGLGDALVAA